MEEITTLLESLKCEFEDETKMTAPILGRPYPSACGTQLTGIVLKSVMLKMEVVL